MLKFIFLTIHCLTLYCFRSKNVKNKTDKNSILFFFALFGCYPKYNPSDHYKKHQDISSLKAAFKLIPDLAETLILETTFGEPVNFEVCE